jgi:hypothetical protein
MAAHLKVLNDWRFAIQRVYERMPFIAIQREQRANAILLRYRPYNPHYPYSPCAVIRLEKRRTESGKLDKKRRSKLPPPPNKIVNDFPSLVISREIQKGGLVATLSPYIQNQR